MSESVSEPHVLVIRARLEEFQGHDGEFYDYEIQHPDSCPKENVESFLLPGWHEEYTCMVAYWLNHIGIDDLTEHGARTLEPGEYKIEGWSAHFPSTPVSGEEWDGGLRFIEEPA